MPDIKAMMPARMSSSPRRTTRRGEALGRSLGMPGAAMSRPTESGSTRTPVFSAESPSTTERNSGMMKKMPDCSRN